MIPPFDFSLAQKELDSLAETEEDLISYALFPMIAKDFLGKRKGKSSVTASA